MKHINNGNLQNRIELNLTSYNAIRNSISYACWVSCHLSVFRLMSFKCLKSEVLMRSSAKLLFKLLKNILFLMIKLLLIFYHLLISLTPSPNNIMSKLQTCLMLPEQGKKNLSHTFRIELKYSEMTICISFCCRDDIFELMNKCKGNVFCMKSILIFLCKISYH